MTREPVELKLESRARKLLREAERYQRRADEDAERARVAREELDAMHEKTEAKFGRAIPKDALLLDLLELIEIEGDDRWVWLGMRNNQNLPVVRRIDRQGEERSLCRYLAIIFGVIAEDDYGILYPREGDTEDINPWHRVLRPANGPVGYGDRYQF